MTVEDVTEKKKCQGCDYLWTTLHLGRYCVNCWHNCNKPMPKRSTQAQPGSEEKMVVMEKRYAAGEQLHHPDDLSIRLTMSEGGRRGDYGRFRRWVSRYQVTRRDGENLRKF